MTKIYKEESVNKEQDGQISCNSNLRRVKNLLSHPLPYLNLKGEGIFCYLIVSSVMNHI